MRARDKARAIQSLGLPVAGAATGPKPARDTSLSLGAAPRCSGNDFLRQLDGRAAHPPKVIGGPRAALSELQGFLAGRASPAAACEWVASAKVAALTGSCPRSLGSVKCGVAAWCAFARQILGRGGHELPPTLDGLLAWSVTFRCSGTFSNYVSYVKLACLACGLNTDAFSQDCSSARACRH